MKKSKPLPPIRQKDPIEEKIEQRRRQILVHSYIYYALDDNIISDSQWSKWAVELAELQEKYPEIAEQTAFAEDFPVLTFLAHRIASMLMKPPYFLYGTHCQNSIKKTVALRRLCSPVVVPPHLQEAC